MSTYHLDINDSHGETVNYPIEYTSCADAMNALDDWAERNPLVEVRPYGADVGDYVLICKETGGQIGTANIYRV